MTLGTSGKIRMSHPAPKTSEDLLQPLLLLASSNANWLTTHALTGNNVLTSLPHCTTYMQLTMRGATCLEVTPDCSDSFIQCNKARTRVVVVALLTGVSSLIKVHCNAASCVTKCCCRPCKCMKFAQTSPRNQSSWTEIEQLWDVSNEAEEL